MLNCPWRWKEAAVFEGKVDCDSDTGWPPLGADEKLPGGGAEPTMWPPPRELIPEGDGGLLVSPGGWLCTPLWWAGLSLLLLGNMFLDTLLFTGDIWNIIYIKMIEIYNRMMMSIMIKNIGNNVKFTPIWLFFFLWLGNSMGIPNPILKFTSNDSLDHKSL